VGSLSLTALRYLLPVVIGIVSLPLPYSQPFVLSLKVTVGGLDRVMASVPMAVQFKRHIQAAATQSEDLIRSFRRLVGTLLPQAATRKNIVVTLRPAIAALLPSKELLAQTLYQVLHTSHKKTAWVAVGLIGLAFFFSLLELSLRRELAREAADAVIDALPAASTSPQQIEFAERFAIEPRTISSEAVGLSVTAEATTVSDDVQTFGQVSRQSVPMPRPRKHR
jgi:hypothetical protein